ncbi:hypothetical protein OG558_12360 [Kribbella sp. NBC_01510]|uniref:Rab family GTPase n=1 Tax=Kribbella sp. NBC_01510 TaxID=2903581 RepID=UPI00386C791C
MTGVDPVTGAVAGAVVKLVIDRGAPAGLRLVRSWLRGQTVLIVGPGASGKTTFLQYLQFGIFLHEQEHQKTYHALESPRFNLALGPNKNLNVSIKTAVDLPGQDADITDIVVAQRPHAMVVILDCASKAKREESAKWLTEFLQLLDQRWLGKSTKKNRLRTMIVVMNKIDKLSGAWDSKFERPYRQAFDLHFKAARGPLMPDIKFRQCVMVESSDGTKWVDAVLIDLATGLQRKA